MSTDQTTSQPATPLNLGQYIAALIEAVGQSYPAALARMRLTVADRRARIFLDDEGVDIVFGTNGLEVSAANRETAIEGEGQTDTATVLDLLDGYLEVTGAILTGRLQATGSVRDVVSMFSAIEILLDASPRTPGLQALALKLQIANIAKRKSHAPAIVHAYSYPFLSATDELSLLGRLDLMPDS